MTCSPIDLEKVNARIAAGRSVLTRTVVYHDESRLHQSILEGKRSGDKPLGRLCWSPHGATHGNSRGAPTKGLR